MTAESALATSNDALAEAQAALAAAEREARRGERAMEGLSGAGVRLREAEERAEKAEWVGELGVKRCVISWRIFWYSFHGMAMGIG
jgi:hypothetical protein